MGNSHAHQHSHARRRREYDDDADEPFPSTVGGAMPTLMMPTADHAEIVAESLSASASSSSNEARRNSVPLLGLRGILARGGGLGPAGGPSKAVRDPIDRSATPPPLLPSAMAPPMPVPAASLSASSSSSGSSGLPPQPPAAAAYPSSSSSRRLPPRVRSLVRASTSSSMRHGLCSLKRRIARQKPMKAAPLPCEVCPAERHCYGPCSISPIQTVCSDAFSHIFSFLSIPEVCAVTGVSRNMQTEVDNALAHLQDALFLAQANSVKLDLLEQNEMILKVLSTKCPRVRRLKSQNYVRISREQCQALLSGCPRIQQISPSIEFQAADIVSVGQCFPDLTEARVHFSTISEGHAFGAVCPSIRSLLIDSDNDQIGEIAAVLGERLPRFKFLSVDLCARSVPRAGVDKIPAKLTLALSVVGNIQKEHCIQLTKCRSNLVTLHLHHIPTNDFPVEGLRYLSRHMRSLKELDLPHTTVSMIRPLDNEIAHVLSDGKGFPALKRLYLKRYSSTFQAILEKNRNHIKLGRRTCS